MIILYQIKEQRASIAQSVNNFYLGKSDKEKPLVWSRKKKAIAIAITWLDSRKFKY